MLMLLRYNHPTFVCASLALSFSNPKGYRGQRVFSTTYLRTKQCRTDEYKLLPSYESCDSLVASVGSIAIGSRG